MKFKIIYEKVYTDKSRTYYSDMYVLYVTGMFSNRKIKVFYTMEEAVAFVNKNLIGLNKQKIITIQG